MPIDLDGATCYSCSEVAAACGVSRQTIWRWRTEGAIPPGRVMRGRRVVFTANEFDVIRDYASRTEATQPAIGNLIYLDNAASTRPLEIVRQAVTRAMASDFGNPSSAHRSGRNARQALETAREAVAVLVGAEAEHVHFTSGGTEANNWLIRGAVEAGVRHIISTPIEHSSVLGALSWAESQGVRVSYLPIGHEGRANTSDLTHFEINDQTLVSIQWANNETGILNPVTDLARETKRRGGWFHSDAAQAVGKLPIDFTASSLDAITFTAHKIHGPQGVGATVLRHGLRLAPILRGGSQERGLRVGTENYPGIVGFGVAAEHRAAMWRGFAKRTRALRDLLEQTLIAELEGARTNGSVERVCTTSNVLIPGLDGQAFVAQLDARGIQISQSSACTNMRPESSYVLRAMGLSEEQAYSSFRFAVSEDTTFEACTRAAREMIEVAHLLGVRRIQPALHPIKEVA
jgi:cysteine desulfurase